MKKGAIINDTNSTINAETLNIIDTVLNISRLFSFLSNANLKAASNNSKLTIGVNKKTIWLKKSASPNCEVVSVNE